MNYKANPALCAYILHRAPAHQPQTDAPSTYGDLRRWANGAWPLRCTDKPANRGC